MVIDEIHLLGADRGPILEVSILAEFDGIHLVLA
jgi:replicative superfamily II helicase